MLQTNSINLAHANPYAGSSLIEAVKTSEGCLSALDVDGTTASYDQLPSPRQMAIKEENFDIAHMQGGVVLSTYRAAEMCMSHERLERSLTSIGRLPPLCAKEGDRLVYAPLESLERYRFNYDPHAIISIGVGVAVENGGAYYLDREFERKLNAHQRRQVPEHRTSWRDGALRLVGELGLTTHLALIEDAANYDRGAVDVMPLPYRIQLQYAGHDGVAWKSDIKERINKLRMRGGPIGADARSVAWVDESHPRLGRYTFYLVPRYGTKEKALTHVVRRVTQELKAYFRDMLLFIAGDTMTDLHAGLYGANGARGIFALAGGSRLTEYLVGEKRGQAFAGESLESIVRRLKKNSRKGFYHIQMPGMILPRVVVILDEIFPNLSDAESILAFYKLLYGANPTEIATPH